MDIGEQQRVIVVEPLEWPEDPPSEEPAMVPDTAPAPEAVPAQRAATG